MSTAVMSVQAPALASPNVRQVHLVLQKAFASGGASHVGVSSLLPPDRHVVLHVPPARVLLFWFCDAPWHCLAAAEPEGVPGVAGVNRRVTADPRHTARDAVAHLRNLVTRVAPGAHVEGALVYTAIRRCQAPGGLTRDGQGGVPILFADDLTLDGEGATALQQLERLLGAESSLAGGIAGSPPEVASSPSPAGADLRHLLFESHLCLPDGRDGIRPMSLDDAQLKAARDLRSDPVAFRGVPGTGKTLALVYHALHRARCHLAGESSSRRVTRGVLLICHTPSMRRWVARIIALTDASASSEETIVVRTIDDLCEDLLGSQESPPAEAEERQEAATARALRLPMSERYDAVLIDEAHRMSEGMLRLAVAMGSGGARNLRVVDDDREPVKRGLGGTDALVPLHVHRLTTYLRAPRLLLEKALALCKDSPVIPERMKFRAHDPCPVPPHASSDHCSSLDEALMKMGREMRTCLAQHHVRPWDIGVVYLPPDDASPDRDDSVLHRAIENALKPYDIPLVCLSGARFRGRAGLPEEAVRCGRLEDMEGLDFEAAFVLYPAPAGNGRRSGDGRLFRALTRARSHLEAIGIAQEEASAEVDPAATGGAGEGTAPSSPLPLEAWARVPRSDETSQVRYAVQHKFPYPIARAYYQVPRESQHDQATPLQKVLGATLEFLAAVALSVYLSDHERGLLSEEILQQLREGGFKPSYGDWRGLLRQAVKRGRRDRFMQPLYDALSRGQGPKQKQAEASRLLDELVKDRNYHTKARDLEPLTPRDVSEFRGKLERAFEEFSFLCHYPLVVVTKSEYRNDVKLYSALCLMGSQNRFDTMEFSTREDVETDQVVLLDPERGTILPLYPFYQYRKCQECGDVPRFWRIEGSTQGRLTYVCARGHKRQDAEAYNFAVGLLQEHPRGRKLRIDAPDLVCVAPAAWRSLPRGTCVDHSYVIEDLLLSGNWSDVYVARTLADDSEVVLKILPLEHLQDQGMRQRFHEEVDLLRRLQHPHVVRVLGCNETLTAHYIAMEMATGWPLASGGLARDLRTWMSGTWQALTEEQILSIVSQAASGLAHLHEASLVHRDLKPANLLLFSHQVVKIADLGLAWRKDHENRGSLAGRQSGSSLYVSPEQAGRVEPLTAASDVYSLGVIAFELATGHLPRRRLRGPTDLDQLLQWDVNRDLAALISSCLSLKPRDRPQDARDLRSRLMMLRKEA